MILHRKNRGGDGVAAPDFLRIKVAGGISVRALAQAVDALGQKQHALGQGGLSVAAVTQQADITNILSSVHRKLLLSWGRPPFTIRAVGKHHNGIIIHEEKFDFNAFFCNFAQPRKKGAKSSPGFLCKFVKNRKSRREVPKKQCFLEKATCCSLKIWTPAECRMGRAPSPNSPTAKSRANAVPSSCGHWLRSPETAWPGSFFRSPAAFYAPAKQRYRNVTT